MPAVLTKPASPILNEETPVERGEREPRLETPAEFSSNNGAVAAEPPQHMTALAIANRVRLARAELKRQVRGGRRNAVEVILNCPWEAESMTVAELLGSQQRWGRIRSRKFLFSLGLSEGKQLGTLTQRQRVILATELHSKIAA